MSELTSEQLSQVKPDTPRIHDLDRQTAGFLQRGFAALIDTLIFAPLTLVIFAPIYIKGMDNITFEFTIYGAYWWCYVLSNLLSLAYGTIMLGRYGRTLGMMALKLRVTNVDASAIGYRKALFRTIIFLLPWIMYQILIYYEIAALIFQTIGFVGLLWIIVDKAHQGYHDKIARTLVMRDNVK